ncbi:MAG: endonuclease III [Bacteroidales bacterium]|jgi:endonuclease-3|nr:endonuclease III [Bacteroidales bacterium]MCK9499564.1 endonuclease III [Bacteroidales bacterium]MDY0316022.1 endonuclease III [Bacteroidales bacterium]NLB85758.1 endonuclease III [Bacteroidales bacterium]
MTIKERYKHVLDYFRENMKLAETELDYKTDFQLLIAVILSAQCTDKRVNLLTPALFLDYPDAQTMSHASQEVIYEYIKSCSYPNNKAKHISQTAKILTEKYNGKIPEDVDELQKLPGVGRKTAHVIASVLFRQAKMPVDTHVFRVSARIGLTNNAKTVLQAEKQLVKHIPKKDIPDAHHWLILHGRYVCTARSPKCASCGISAYCKFYQQTDKS